MSDSHNLPDQYAHHALARASGLSAVQEEICRRVMEGESIRSICRDDTMPSKSTVMDWLATDLEFRAAYALAKQILAETFAEEIIEISDDASQDWKEGEGGERVFDHEHVHRAKLRVDSRKWLAGKLAPKRYGDASLLRITDAGNERREISPQERAVRMAALAAAWRKLEGG